MTELLEFISVLLDGAAFVALSLSLGGMVCTLVVLRPIHDQDPVIRSASNTLLKVSVLSLCGMAGLRLFHLALKALALNDALGSLGWQAVLQTRPFRFGTLGILLALGLAWSVAWVRRDVSRRLPWGVVLLMAGLFMANEAWLSHAASRFENQRPLMMATMAHVCGATVWAGGVGHMVLLWRMMRERHADRWPGMVARFSPLGMGCVGLIVGPGVFLWWQYVGGWAGLIGTGYGNVLLVKIVLFGCVLALAASSFQSARHWAKGKALGSRSGPVPGSIPDYELPMNTVGGRRRGTDLFLRVPAYLEVETLLAVVLLFAAVFLTGFPPSVDIPQEPVTFSEIRVMYEPKIPHLGGPERILIDAPELTDLRTGEPGKKEDVSWDRFNHNVSGVIVLAMGSIALFGQRLAWARLWPLAFLGFSVLIFVFSNPDHWPLGPIGFTASVQDPEVMQHWSAAMLVFGLGWSGWLVSKQPSGGKVSQFLFPILCLVGGVIMLTHSHGVLERKEEFLIQNTHVSIGLLAVLMGYARWLEIRLPSPHNRLAGRLSWLAMVLVGLILLFYVKPNLPMEYG